MMRCVQHSRKNAAILFMAGAFGAVAQIAAYNESEEWLEELKEYLRGNAQFIADFIQKRMPKVKYRIPEATYLGWLDFRLME